ncbi:MAG: helix-turn-helix domain-containing protein [Muribaculaceae bacterium]|nr:helix-turn-helix domain-containing protein [Muribaculaceae bacterium]
MDIISRLKRYMEKYQIGSSQFADYAGISRPTLSQILNGRNKKISDELISKIHNAYPRLSVLWLLFGEGEMELPLNNEISESQIEQKSAIPSSQSPIDEKFTESTDLFGINPEKNSENSSSPASSPAFTFPSTPRVIEQIFSDEDVSAPDLDRNSAGSISSNLNNSQATSPKDATTVFDKDKFLSESFSQSSSHGKKIKNIVVFYDDATFETFLPG